MIMQKYEMKTNISCLMLWKTCNCTPIGWFFTQNIAGAKELVDC